MYLCSTWTLHCDTYQLWNKTECVQLEQKQVALLQLFVERSGKVVSKSDILDHVWPNRFVSEDAIYVLINSIRNALGDNAKSPEYIKTVSGQGYLWLKSSIEQKKHNKSLLIQGIIGGVLVISTVCLSWWYIEPERAPLSHQAKQDFIKSRYLIHNQTGRELEALTLLHRALALEPNYIPLLEELIGVYFNLVIDSRLTEYQQPLYTAIARLLDIDDENKLAHLYKARVAFLLDKTFEVAQSHFERALGTAQAHSHYGQFLLAKRQFKDALAHTYQYQLLDPSGYSSESVAWVYLMSGNLQQGFKELDRLAQYSEGSHYYHVCLQALYELSNKPVASFKQLIRLMEYAGYKQHDLDLITDMFEREGLKGAYLWLLKHDTKHLNIGQYSPPMSLARYAVSAGENTLAIAYLKQAVKAQQISVLWLGADPKFKPLYNNPDFLKILEDLNLSI